MRSTANAVIAYQGGPRVRIPVLPQVRAYGVRVMNPYEGYKVYGPYPDRTQGREVVTLWSSTHRTSTPYPRYLMAMHLGRLLTPEEEVDHIDGDPSNNDLENLRVVTPLENKARNTKPLVQLICPNCEQRFERKRNRVREAWGGATQMPTCCSRRCSGQYQHKVGLGGGKKRKGA